MPKNKMPSINSPMVTTDERLTLLISKADATITATITANTFIGISSFSIRSLKVAFSMSSRDILVALGINEGNLISASD